MKMLPAVVAFLTAIAALGFGHGFHLLAQERSPIYPFDVEVAGQAAVPPGGPAVIFASIPQPVAPDSHVDVDSEGGMIIVNVFAIDENGAPLSGAQGQAKVIMVQDGSGFDLDRTMDKSILAPGRYGMNIVLQNQGTSRVQFTVGTPEQLAKAAAMKDSPAQAKTQKPTPAGAPVGSGTPAAAAGRATPGATMSLFIQYAREGKFDAIRSFAAPDCDGDVREICAVADAPDKDKARFRNFFGGGKVLGEARIDGDKAEVDFTFGDKQEKQETMNLQRIDSAWYLLHF